MCANFGIFDIFRRNRDFIPKKASFLLGEKKGP